MTTVHTSASSALSRVLTGILRCGAHSSGARFTVPIQPGENFQLYRSPEALERAYLTIPGGSSEKS